MSIPVFIKNQKILLQKAIEKDYFKHGNKIRFNFLLTGMSQSKEYIYISNGDKSVYHIFRINAINIENIVVENLQGCLVSEE
jgi:hypothetical protein